MVSFKVNSIRFLLSGRVENQRNWRNKTQILSNSKVSDPRNSLRIQPACDVTRETALTACQASYNCEAAITHTVFAADIRLYLHYSEPTVYSFPLDRDFFFYSLTLSAEAKQRGNHWSVNFKLCTPMMIRISKDKENVSPSVIKDQRISMTTCT